MLREIINSLSFHSEFDPQEFWEKVSADNIEDFLLGYELPESICSNDSKDYTLLKYLIKEDIIEKDDSENSLLGSSELDIVSNILLFTIMYGSFLPLKNYVNLIEV